MKNRIVYKLIAGTLVAGLVMGSAACGSSDKDTSDFLEEEIPNEDEEDTVEYEDFDDLEDIEEGEPAETEETDDDAYAADEAYDDAADEYAEEDTFEEDEGGYYPTEFEDIGVTLYIPEEYVNRKGVVNYSEETLGDKAYCIDMYYVGVSQDWYYETVSQDEISDEDARKYIESLVDLFRIYSVKKDEVGELVDYLNEELEANGLTKISADDLKEIKSGDDYAYYLYDVKEDANYQNLEPEYAEEYDELKFMTDQVIDASAFSEPKGTYDNILGQKISFVTTDFDGNEITSEELFSQHEYTMVNVWATWCPWCVGELEELEKINKKLEEKDCAIVGLGGDSDSAIDDARAIVAENGLTYTQLRAFDGWYDIFNMSEGWPTSFFVNREGEMVGMPIPGARVDEYEKAIDDLLAGKTNESAGAATSEDENAAAGEDTAKAQNDSQKAAISSKQSESVANGQNMYRIYVTDEKANPIQGAMVQFCTSDTCKMGITGADGMASFDDPEGSYDVHILKVPDGYKPYTEEHKTMDVYSDMVIVLQRE